MRATAETWGLILAGGDGLRLRSLTRLITGDERPKQFCKILGQDTLLGTLPPDQAIIQPAGQGTAPAILYGLLRIATEDPLAELGVEPAWTIGRAAVAGSS